MTERRKGFQPTDFSDLAIVERKLASVVSRVRPDRKVRRVRFDDKGNLVASDVASSEFFEAVSPKRSSRVDWAGKALSAGSD